MVHLFVGLGNPGRQFEYTRHNMGYHFLDKFVKNLSIRFSLEKKFNGWISSINYHGKNLYFLKPDVFMNLSGYSVRKVCDFYKIIPNNVIVLHDEMDLMPGTIKFKFGGGHAGHNGVKSIGQHLLSQSFWRIRIGIGHPRSLDIKQDACMFVLHSPNKEEWSKISFAMESAENILKDMLNNEQINIETITI